MTEPFGSTQITDVDEDLLEPEPDAVEDPVDPEDDPPSFGGLSSTLLGWIVGSMLVLLVGSKAWAVWYVVTRSEEAEKNDWAQVLEQVNALDAVITAIVGGILGIKIQGLQTKKAQEKAKKNRDVANRQKQAATKNRKDARNFRRKAHRRGVAILDAAARLESATPSPRRVEVRGVATRNLLQGQVSHDLSGLLSLDSHQQGQLVDHLTTDVVDRLREADPDDDGVDEAAIAQSLRAAL